MQSNNSIGNLSKLLLDLDNNNAKWDKVLPFLEKYMDRFSAGFLINATGRIYSTIHNPQSIKIWMDTMIIMVRTKNFMVVKNCLENIVHENITISHELHEKLIVLISDLENKHENIIPFFKSFLEDRFFKFFDEYTELLYHPDYATIWLKNLASLVEDKNHKILIRCLREIQETNVTINDQQCKTLSYLISGLEDNQYVWNDIMPLFESIVETELLSYLETSVDEIDEVLDDPREIELWLYNLKLMISKRNSKIIIYSLEKISEFNDASNIVSVDDEFSNELSLRFRQLIEDLKKNTDVWNKIEEPLTLFTKPYIVDFIKRLSSNLDEETCDHEVFRLWFDGMQMLIENKKLPALKICLQNLHTSRGQMLGYLHTHLHPLIINLPFHENKYDYLKSFLELVEGEYYFRSIGSHINLINDPKLFDIVQIVNWLNNMEEVIIGKSPVVKRHLEYINQNDTRMDKMHRRKLIYLISALDGDKNVWGDISPFLRSLIRSYLSHFLIYNAEHISNNLQDTKLIKNWMKAMTIMTETKNKKTLKKCFEHISRTDINMTNDLRNTSQHILSALENDADDIWDDIIPFLKSLLSHLHNSLTPNTDEQKKKLHTENQKQETLFRKD